MFIGFGYAWLGLLGPPKGATSKVTDLSLRVWVRALGPKEGDTSKLRRDRMQNKDGRLRTCRDHKRKNRVVLGIMVRWVLETPTF